MTKVVNGMEVFVIDLRDVNLEGVDMRQLYTDFLTYEKDFKNKIKDRMGKKED